MTAAVDVVDDTGLVGDRGIVKRLVEAVLAAQGFQGEVAVVFVGESTITDLNRRYRESATPTDVLSFVYTSEEAWPGDAGAGGVAGEIVVCPQVVLRYAAEEGREPAGQLGWTLVHGALHVAGYDHETDRGEMREREQQLLEQKEGLVRLLSLSGQRG